MQGVAADEVGRPVEQAELALAPGVDLALDPEVADLPILRETRENVTLDTVMSNSFGFGGTNATLVLKRWQGK